MLSRSDSAVALLGTLALISGCGFELAPAGRNPGGGANAMDEATSESREADLGGVPPALGGGQSSPVPPPATPVDSSQPAPAALELNAGWIGGACSSAADCDELGYTATPVCETGGFPSGMCTQSCTVSASGTYVCPDADEDATTLATVTRCIDAGGAPRCASECDFSLSATGCRPGYSCVLRQRYNEPSRILQICLPSAGQRWPGEPAPPADVGSPCDGPEDCAHLSCLSYAGGYCSKSMCASTGCPVGSSCFTMSGSDNTQCIKQCTTADDCRADEGYYCESSHSTCWPDDGGRWNSTVGLADCARAWGDGGRGLSRCDSTPDHYVVIHKSARNLALCKRGVLVESFSIGLGFAPTGDKEVEGDGRTPEGVFYVARTVPASSYYRAFLISYPDRADAARGYADGTISASQKSAIESAQTRCSEPPQYTGLGGMVEIHGHGGSSDWTLGCVAADNSAIDEVWSVLKTRDTIVILP